MNRFLSLMKKRHPPDGNLPEMKKTPLTKRIPRALLLAACAAALPVLVGCVAYVHGGFPIVIGSPHHDYDDYHPYYHPRPYSSYFCYDCHGYTYFDPYYDYCANFGFRIDWGHRTPLWRYYTRHHNTIVWKMGHPQYKYKYDYREGPKYKSPSSYERWKQTDGRTYYSTKEKSTETKKSTDVKKSTSGKSSKTTKSSTTTKTTTKTKAKSTAGTKRTGR